MYDSTIQYNVDILTMIKTNIMCPIFCFVYKTGCESTLRPVWLSTCVPADDWQTGGRLLVCDSSGRDGGPARCAHWRAPYFYRQGCQRLYLSEDLKVRFLWVSLSSLLWAKCIFRFIWCYLWMYFIMSHTASNQTLYGMENTKKKKKSCGDSYYEIDFYFIADGTNPRDFMFLLPN